MEMERFVILLYCAFMIVFFVFPASLVIADRFSDRVHAWLKRRIRKARRDLAAWLIAPEGLTVVSAENGDRRTEQASTGLDDFLSVIWRDA